MSNNEVNNLIYLIESNNYELIQEYINNLKGKITIMEYNSIIEAIFKHVNLSNEIVLKSLFSQKLTFSIKTYKELLTIEATHIFNKLKDNNENVFVLLSKNICNDLTIMSVEDIIVKYSNELEFIKSVKMLSEFIHLIRDYKESILSCDVLKINSSKSEIREFIRRFNLKYKLEFIRKYCTDKLKQIEPFFEVKPKYECIGELLSKDAFLKLVLNDIHMTNNLKLKLSNYFNMEIENTDLKKIILNILNNKDIDNHKLFGISTNLIDIDKKLEIYNDNKSYNRLIRIYQSKINKLFNNEEKKYIIDILNNNNLSDYRKIFNKAKYELLFDLLIIMKRTNCTYQLKDNNIVFIKKDRLDNINYELLKEDIHYYKLYESLKKIILHYYYAISNNKKKIIERQQINLNNNLVFDDDNYQIKNNISLLNYKLLIEILKKIDYQKFNNYNEDQIKIKKKILFKEGLLGCVMKFESCIDISKIINGIDYCDYMTDKSIDIERIVKLTSIYDIANDFTISILGTEVVRKLICNEQFLQTNTLEDKKERLKKAVILNLLAINYNKSSIPYEIGASVDGVKISRYNNDDPKIFKSGIDTGTCFKLDGDDNDFVIYTVLNKNGAVFKIEYQNKLIGRISVIRNNRVLYLNSIRIKNEKEEKLSKEIIDRNYKIFECVKKISNQIIDVAHKNNDEIDYVVVNKAGILESSYFNEYYYIVPEHIVKQPIDIYNDDWIEFINISYEYLKQSNRGKNVPFTTDFGHYPALQIASFNNSYLTSLMDIGYQSPDSIYTRPKKELRLYTSNFKDILENIYRIDALKYYEDIKDIDYCFNTYKRPKINVKDIKMVSISDYYYRIEYLDGTIKEVSLNTYESSKQLIKVIK